MPRTIKINISDPVTDALVKSQNKRIQVLESMIKKKKKNKKDAMGELRELNSVKSLIKQSESRIKGIQDKTASMISAFKNSNKAPKITIVNQGSGQRVVPYPS